MNPMPSITPPSAAQPPTELRVTLPAVAPPPPAPPQSEYKITKVTDTKQIVIPYLPGDGYLMVVLKSTANFCMRNPQIAAVMFGVLTLGACFALWLGGPQAVNALVEKIGQSSDKVAEKIDGLTEKLDSLDKRLQRIELLAPK